MLGKLTLIQTIDDIMLNIPSTQDGLHDSTPIPIYSDSSTYPVASRRWTASRVVVL
jgi:hypothetical protein